jgi:hypothetical protein
MTFTQQSEVWWSCIYGECYAAYLKITATYTAATRGTLLPNVLNCKKLKGYYSAPSNTDVEEDWRFIPRVHVAIRCDPGEEKCASGQCTGINQQDLKLTLSRYLIIIICTSAENIEQHII